LQNTSERIRDGAKTFFENAKELKKVTKWNNRKLTFAVGGVSLAAVGYFIYAFFFKG
jgi:hypothetical protein